VHADFARYNRLDGDDDLADDAGWKLVHGDVFRAPTRAAALAIAVGTGAQVTAVTVITLVFALLGLLSPANRGGLLSAMLLLWALTGAVPGFVSAVLYGRWGGMDRKKVTLGAGMAYPGLVGTLFFLLNLMLWAAGSTMSVSFFTLLLLLALWLFVAMPLCIVGAYGGYKVKTADWPTRVNAIARAIPRPPMGVSPSWYALATGILCFGVVFIELVMVLTSQLYYMFGFLFIVFALLVASCAEVRRLLIMLFLVCSVAGRTDGVSSSRFVLALWSSVHGRRLHWGKLTRCAIYDYAPTGWSIAISPRSVDHLPLCACPNPGVHRVCVPVADA